MWPLSTAITCSVSLLNTTAFLSAPPNKQQATSIIQTLEIISTLPHVTSNMQKIYRGIYYGVKCFKDMVCKVSVVTSGMMDKYLEEGGSGTQDHNSAYI